jgi:GntP family gluconate:H+ symporter
LIAFASFFGIAAEAFTWEGPWRSAFQSAEPWVVFFGNKNVALFLGALVAVALVLWRKSPGRKGLAALMEGPFQTAGVIILITSAGGAFGTMIKYSGVADTVKALAGNWDVPYFALAWLVAAVLKIAQGSGTVAMITASSMMFGMVGDGAGLPHHPLYIFLAIGYGSLAVSWMNDSGFWVVGRLSGFSERQTLATWTLLLAAISVTGLLQTWLLATVLPLR